LKNKRYQIIVPLNKRVITFSKKIPVKPKTIVSNMPARRNKTEIATVIILAHSFRFSNPRPTAKNKIEIGIKTNPKINNEFKTIVVIVLNICWSDCCSKKLAIPAEGTDLEKINPTARTSETINKINAKIEISFIPNGFWFISFFIIIIVEGSF
jgi:hypothetical protein